MLTLKLWSSFGTSLCRYSSSRLYPSLPSLPESQQRVVVADGGRTVVCWHPEEPFPYEFTKPLPVVAPPEDVSLLKDLKVPYKALTPEETRTKLAKMTFSTKHAWFPKARLRKTKPMPKADREYL